MIFILWGNTSGWRAFCGVSNAVRANLPAVSDFAGWAGGKGGELLREEVIKRFHGGEFVILDVENGVKLGHVQHVLDFLGEVQQL
jgi:hypothetical protein